MAKSKKGSAFEREICNKLSEWWTGEKGSSVFWRTSNSGGRATTRGKKGKATRYQCGDITAIDPIGQPLMDLITTEIKRGYNKDTVADLLDRSPDAAEQTYEKWITKIKETAERAGSYTWILIVRRDRRLPLVILPQRDLDDLSGEYLDSFIRVGTFPFFIINVTCYKDKIIALPFDNFLKILCKETMVTLAEIQRRRNSGKRDSTRI